MIRTDTRRALTSLGFWASIAGIVIAGLLLGLNNIEVANKTVINPNWPQYLMSVLLTVTSDIFIMLIPVFSTFAFSSAFIEEYSSGFTKSSLMRTGKKEYSFSKTVTVMLSGGLSVILGLSVLTIIFYFSIPDYLNTDKSYADQYYTFFVEFMSVAVNGALWSIVGSISSIVTKNKYIAFAFPFVFFYVLSVFQSRYYPDMILLNPTEIMRSPVYIGSVEIGLIVSLIVLGILSCIHYLCIRNRIKSV